MKQLKMILTVGISNSGKSTWTKQFLTDNAGYVEVNRDTIRAIEYLDGDETQLAKYKFTKAKEARVTTMQYHLIDYAVHIEGLNVIISDTNLNPKTRKQLKHRAEQLDMEYIEQVFDEHLHVCKARNLKRMYTLPPSVLDRQELAMRLYLGKKQYTGTPHKVDTVIVDLDGTTACMLGIRKPFEWHKVGLDNPRQNVINLVLALKKTGLHIVFMSGRDGVAFGDTYDWLTEHGSPFPHLLMRKKGDSRPDAVIKEEIFWKDVAPNHNVLYCIDDRNQMVDAWRSIGLECLQVQAGDF